MKLIRIGETIFCELYRTSFHRITFYGFFYMMGKKKTQVQQTGKAVKKNPLLRKKRERKLPKIIKNNLGTVVKTIAAIPIVAFKGKLKLLFFIIIYGSLLPNF